MNYKIWSTSNGMSNLIRIKKLRNIDNKYSIIIISTKFIIKFYFSIKFYGLIIIFLDYIIINEFI